MAAAMASLGASATRVTRAPVSVPSDGADAVSAPEVDLAREMVTQRQALYAFKANLRVMQAHDEMMGSLLDTFA